MKEKQGKKLTTDVVFGKTVCNVPRNLRTQEVDKSVDSWDEVADCILDMFEDEDEFVTLTVGELKHQIRYVQACQVSGGITVQVGIEEGEQTRLVEKMCTQDECMNIFREFYESAVVRNVEEYTPVKFWA